jgi:hypothetical protein
VSLTELSESAIGAVFGGVARLRGNRALHPRGSVRPATVRREGLEPATGVPWLDQAGTDHVLVRLSRGAGLAPPKPDLLGLALRVSLADDQVSDLLLTTTGRAPVSRHVLRPARDPYRADYTSIVPFRTPTGRLMVGAFADISGVVTGGADAGGGFVLMVASVRGPWRRFGYLELAAGDVEQRAGDVEPRAGDAEEQPDVDFDPVLHPVPQLDLPGWLAHLRAPAYRASRRARD